MSFLEGSDSQADYYFSSEAFHRVSISLPVAKGREKLAAKATILKLQGKFDSYTFSGIDSPCFTGRWKNSVTGKVYRDLISILTIDIAIIGEDSETDYSDLVANAMWIAAESEYARFKADQDSFWIVVNNVSIREKVWLKQVSDPQTA